MSRYMNRIEFLSVKWQWILHWIGFSTTVYGNNYPYSAYAARCLCAFDTNGKNRYFLVDYGRWAMGLPFGKQYGSVLIDLRDRPFGSMGGAYSEGRWPNRYQVLEKLCVNEVT